MSHKVLFFVDSITFGGVEQAVLRLIEGLDRDVWQPVLVHHPYPGLAPLIQRADQLQLRRIETAPMPLGTSGMKEMFHFMNILHREQPAIFHAHLSWPLACKWGIVASLLSRTPATVVTEQLFLNIPYSRMARLQQRLMAQGVGKYIAVSNGIAEDIFQAFQIPKNKIRVIHNAVPPMDDIESNPPAEIIALKKKSNRPLVITVARLDEQKGHRYLIEAACRVPEATFVLVGDGAERTVLEEQVRRFKLDDRVFFFGFQKNIRDWLSACDIFVLPSLYEGLPLSILEAMAVGKPVITTDIPGNRDAVVHGVSGLLVPSQNADALATAIQSMISDPSMQKRMGQAGKEIVSHDFSLTGMIRQVTEVYAECLEGRL